jgi:hypothetical protein
VSGAKHTPGPWVAEEVGVTDMGPNGVPVFEVCTQGGHRRICEYLTAADAHLIAAAPALFAACEAMSAHYSGSLDHQPAFVALARAAIAKALGSTAC